jgi:hypothetical protein
MRGNAQRRPSIAGAVLALVTASVLGVGTAHAGLNPRTEAATSDGDEFFVVQAENGALREHGGDLTLTVRDVDRKVDYFSERPEDVSGSVTVKQLLRLWDEHGLDQQPPSAVLTVLDGNGAGTTTAVELTNPSYEDGALTFDAEPQESLDGKPVAPELSEQTSASTGDPPESFGEASLYIDPPNDVIQYCFARVINRYGTGITGKGTQVFPTSSGISYLGKDEIKTVSASGAFVCNIDYSFRSGSHAWGLSMVAATGADNKSTCGPSDKCIRTVTHDTSTYRVDFELR